MNNLQKPHNLPTRLNTKGIYYGHIVLFVGTIGVIMSIPGQTMGISVYTDYLIDHLNLSRKQLSFAYLLGTISSSFILPYAGRVLDKKGSRFLAVIAATGLSLALTYIALTPQLLHLIGINSTFVSFAIIYFGFLGVRHFGQGQLTMASRTMMGMWFEKRRGLMLGISGLFVAFGFGLAPLALTELIELFNWQKSLFVLAMASLTMAVIAYVFYRRSPESVGLKIDGGLLAPNTEDNQESDLQKLSDDHSFTANQAKRTYTFWIFNLAMVGQATFVTAITFHMSFIGKLNGIASTDVFKIFLPIAIVSTLSDLVAGYFSDRIQLKYLVTLMQLALFGALISATYFDTQIGYYLMATGFGISGGVFAQLTGSAWPKLFGRKYLGSISGIAMSCMVFGSAIGPYLFSLGGQTKEGVDQIILLCSIFPFSLIFASFWANNPRKSK